MNLRKKLTYLSTSFILASSTIFLGTEASANADINSSLGEKTEAITGTEDLITPTTAGSVENNFNVIDLPGQSDNKITLVNKETAKEDLKISVPNDMKVGTPEITDSGSYEYKNNGDVDLIVQPTENGVRSLMNIKNANAPKEYKFDLDLPAGHKVMLSSEYFGEEPGSELDTGEVFIVDENNIIQSVFGTAWAKDANGMSVPTHYKVVDNTLIQVVNFTENTAFPVIADPDWVAIGACSAALTWFVGSNLFVAAKIIKVRKYIKALGGFKETAKLIAGATSWEEKLRVGGSALRSLAAEITGVTGLYACNKFIKK